MKFNIITAALAFVVAASALPVGAQDGSSAVNPTGSWKLITGTNINFAQTLKLKMEGSKLSGTLSRQAGGQVEQLPLLNPKLIGNAISFETHNYAVFYVKNVRQPTDTNKWSHSTFQGTIDGGTINGTVKRESFMTGPRTWDFEAKRIR